MKKILFLLLSTIAMYGQVPADATPLENIQITNNTTDNSATKVNVQSTDGTINTISKSDLVNVVEVNDVPSLPLVGEVGKIYVVKNVNKIYRWNGTFYQELAGSDINYQSIIDALTFTPENVANKVTSIGSPANDTNYPSELAVKTYADNLVVGMLNDRGAWDASVNVFPATGGSGVGGAIRKGDMWYVSVAGTLGTKSVNVGDSFRALVNAPSQVAADWSILEANIGYVPANDSDVVHLTGAETITGQKTFSPTISASGAIARGTYLTPSLTATANNDVLVGLDINTTFTNGAFTGTKSLPVRVTSNQYIGMNVSRNSTGGSAITISNNNGGYNFGVGSINEFFIQRAGGNIVNTIFSTGNSIIQNGGAFTDDLTNRLQVTGTVSSGTTALGNTPPTANNQLTRKDYVDTGLALKANLASPALTGTPTAPTATAGANTTQVATTAFVAGELAIKENAFSKNTAFNKNFGITASTVAEGNDSRINNGQTAYSWGNHAGKYPLYNGTGATGTWGINISGNASSATSWESYDYDSNNSSQLYGMGYNSSTNKWSFYNAESWKAWLGLGSNAYTSTVIPTNTNQLTNGSGYITDISGKVDKVTGKSLIADSEITRLATVTNQDISGKENAFTKNTAFNKPFGITAGTVVEGGTLGSNAYNSTAYLPLTGGTINTNNETINYKVSSNNEALYSSWYDFNNNRISFLGFGGGTQSNATFFVNSENGGNIALNTTGVGKVVVSSLSGAVDGNIVAASDGTIKRGTPLGSNAYTSTVIPTNTNQLTNGSGFITDISGKFDKTGGTISGNVNVTGTVTASPATASNHLVTKAQLDASATSRPYKVYTALISQSGTNAPTAVVLENTLGGTVVWSRTNTGQYLGTLTGAFTGDKTISFFQSGSSNPGYAYTYSSYKDSNNSVRLYALSNGSYQDQLIDGQIEIRVYL